MIQINPLQSYIDGGARAAITSPPSASLVFDLPGKAIWVKGVKLKGIDHTYTFSHDNYITLTNTPDQNNPESEDIKIGVNITALKNVIDTTYSVVTASSDGLALAFSNGNKATTSANTTYHFLGLAGTTLKWYELPHRNIYVETTEVQSVSNTDPLKFAAGDGIEITWDSTNKKIVITNSSPDVNHNTDNKVAQASTSTNYDYPIILKGTNNLNENITNVNFSQYLTFNPNTKILKINSSLVVTMADVYVGATASAAATSGLVPAASSANRNKFLRGDGTWQVPTNDNTWRPVKVEGTQKLASTTDTNALDFHGDTGIEITYDATNKKINIKNTAPDVNHNTDRTGIKLGTVSGTKKTDSTVILANSTAGLNIAGGTNKFSIGDGTNYIEVPITPSFTVSNKAATIGTSLTTIATINGTDITAKIASYVPFETSSTLASINDYNHTPIFYVLSGTEMISGYGKYWYVINMGKHTGGNHGAQIALNYSNESSNINSEMFIRKAKNDTWEDWVRVLHSKNWSSYITWDTLPGKPNTFTPSPHSHNYIDSLGDVAPETGRTHTRGGVYTYRPYSNSAGGPSTYGAVIGFGWGTRGSGEIWTDWCGGGIWYRTLRDCCEDWYPWRRIADASNISNKDATIGTSSTTIATIAGVNITAKIGSYAASNHTHPLSIAVDSGTSSIALAASTKYKLTAGGSTYVFTSTPDQNVKQTPKTDNVNRPLMMINGGTGAGELTSTSMFSTGIYANASSKMITANGFIKTGSDSSHVLLGDGGHKALSELMLPLNTNPANTIETHIGGWSPISGRYVFRQNWTDSSTGGDTADLSIYLDGNLTANMCLDGYYNTLSGYKIIGYDNSYVLLAGGGAKALTDFSLSDHTHNYITSLGNKAASDLSSTYPAGLSNHGIYNNGYPFTYGCGITSIGNGGAFQIAGQWNADVASLTDYDYPTEMYIRGRRDSYDVWTTWSRVLTDRNWSNVITLPTVNDGTLSLLASGSTKTTFTANQSGNSTFNIATGSGNGTISVGGTDVAVKGLGSAAYLANTDFVRAYGTTNDNIDSDWGQSFKTFDPIPAGTPPEQNPNITLLSLGNGWARRKMLAFTYSNDNIYYRRHYDSNFTAWVRLIHSGNYTDYTVTKTGGGASGTWGINITGSAGSLSTTRYIYGNAFNGTQDVSGNFNMSTGDQINMTGASWDGFAFNYYSHSSKTNGLAIRFYNGKLVEIVRFLANGNVGIGTSSPSTKLHVNGNTRIDFTSGYGTYYYGPAGESSIEFFNNGTRKAVFGSYSNCAFIWNANRANTLRYNDNGTLTFEGNTVWHAGNDGSGSGLDADLLDGLNSSYFLTYKDQITGTAPTFSQEDQGVKYYSHYSGNPLGNFRAIIVGKSNSGSTGLEFNAYWCVNPTDSTASNNIYFRVKRDAASDWGPYTRLILGDGNQTINGTLTATHFYETSDIRLKHDISMLSKSIRRFRFNNDNKLYYGFIAQELETLHPELVDSSGEYKTVNYNSAICYYIAELENKVQKLEDEINKLKNK